MSDQLIIGVKVVATGLNQLDQTKAKIQQLDEQARKGGASIFGLNEKLIALKSAVFTERDVNKVKLFNAEIKATSTEIKALEGAGTKGSGGIAAIGNAGTKALSSVRQLAYILPGIGIAGLIGFATGPIIDYVSSLLEIPKAIQEITQENEKFQKSLDDVKAKGISTGLQLQSFVAIARDQTQSIDTRNEAIKKANEILGEHGEKLTLVNIATKAVTDEINKFTQATIQQALASKFADRAADLIIKQREAATSYGKELDKLNKFKEISSKTSETSLTGESRITAEADAVRKQTNAVIQQASAYRLITSQLRDVSGSLQDAQLQASKFFGDLDGPKQISGIIAKIKAQIDALQKAQPGLLSGPEIVKNVAAIKKLQDELDRLEGKTKKSGETIIDVLSKLRRELEFLTAKGIAFEINTKPDKIKEITATIEKLIKDFKVAPDDTIIKKLFGDIELLRPLVLKSLDEVIKEYEKGINERITKQPITLQIKPVIKGIDGKVELPKDTFFLAGQDLADALNKGLQDGLESTLENSLINFGEILGNAIAGKADIGDFFDGLFKQIGAGLKTLGQYFIKTAIEIKIFKDFATKYPLLAIAAGVALIALGSLIQSQTSSKKAFAKGGLVGGTGTGDTVNALLDPREFVLRPEAVRRIGVDNLNALNNGSAMNASIGVGVAGGQVVFIANSVISGNDIVTSYIRTSQSKGRIG